MEEDNTGTIFYTKHHKHALDYTKTYNAPYRYLSYRDVPKILQKYLPGKKTLDYGCGTGYSTQFLNQLGFNVVGIDSNLEMIQQARLQHPHLNFHHINNQTIPFEDHTFDLVFSSFVLSEIGSQTEMIDYLLEANRVMKDGTSLFVVITCHEALHDPSRTWLDFYTKFPENINRASGSLVKAYHYNSHIEFSDYYWTQADYQLCFAKANFNVIDIQFPLGKIEEDYKWKDELTFAPFMILLARLNE